MKCTTKQKNQLETRKTLIFSQVLSMAHASSMNNHGSATRDASSYDFLCVWRMFVRTFLRANDRTNIWWNFLLWTLSYSGQIWWEWLPWNQLLFDLQGTFFGIGCKSWRIKSAFSYAQTDQLSDLFSVKLRDWTEKSYQNLNCLFLRAKTERSLLQRCSFIIKNRKQATNFSIYMYMYICTVFFANFESSSFVWHRELSISLPI